MPATRPAEIRFWEKVDKDGPLPEHRPDLGSCWLWTAGKYANGYGSFSVNAVGIRAHRFAYELLVGTIPDGLTLDHLCRVRACVNPRHLEPVTMVENVLRGVAPTAINARKTECVHGHVFDVENTYRNPRGGRKCRACRNAETLAHYYRNRDRILARRRERRAA